MPLSAALDPVISCSATMVGRTERRPCSWCSCFKRITGTPRTRPATPANSETELKIVKQVHRWVYRLRGVPRWRDRFPQCGIKVSSWGSGTFKIVIPVENHPQKPENRLADYHPLWGGGVFISGQIYVLTIYLHIGVVNSGRHDSPHIRKSSLDHDSGGKKGVSITFLDIFHVSRVYQCNSHVS